MGKFTINDIPEGSRIVAATATDFTENSVPVSVLAGKTQTVNISLDPVGGFPNQIKIILNWAPTPLDLDAHLLVPSTPPI